MTVFQKLFEIIKGVDILPKTAYNETEKYYYTPVDVVMEYVRKKLIEHGVLLVYSTSMASYDPVTSNRRIVGLSWKFIDAQNPEDRIEGTWIGEGYSTGGYGTLTAISSAIKQHQMKFFYLQSGDDPETLNGSSPQQKLEAIPPVVEPEKLEVPAVTIPGEKRRRRSSKKAVEEVVGKIDDTQKVDTQIQEVVEQSEGFLEQSPLEISVQEIKSSQTMLSIEYGQMKEGLESGMVEEINRDDVVGKCSSIPVYYTVNPEGKTIYAKIK